MPKYRLTYVIKPGYADDVDEECERPQGQVAVFKAKHDEAAKKKVPKIISARKWSLVPTISNRHLVRIVQEEKTARISLTR